MGTNTHMLEVQGWSKIFWHLMKVCFLLFVRIIQLRIIKIKISFQIYLFVSPT
jgi:hypothetical protein